MKYFALISTLIAVLGLLAPLPLQAKPLGGSQGSLAKEQGFSGTYEFGEGAPPNQSWAYCLVIGGGEAKLSIDGFQTMLRYDCKCQVRGNKADILFSKAGAENRSSAPQKGAVLFTLEMREGKIRTLWGAFKPYLVENEKNSKAFQKVSKNC